MPDDGGGHISARKLRIGLQKYALHLKLNERIVALQHLNARDQIEKVVFRIDLAGAQHGQRVVLVLVIELVYEALRVEFGLRVKVERHIVDRYIQVDLRDRRLVVDVECVTIGYDERVHFLFVGLKVRPHGHKRPLHRLPQLLVVGLSKRRGSHVQIKQCGSFAPCQTLIEPDRVKRFIDLSLRGHWTPAGGLNDHPIAERNVADLCGHLVVGVGVLFHAYNVYVEAVACGELGPHREPGRVQFKPDQFDLTRCQIVADEYIERIRVCESDSIKNVSILHRESVEDACEGAAGRRGYLSEIARLCDVCDKRVAGKRVTQRVNGAYLIKKRYGRVVHVVEEGLFFAQNRK